MDFIGLIERTQFFFENYGYLTIFISSFIEITPLGWTVPGGVIIALAGFFANTDKNLNLVSIIGFGTLGSWLTLLSSYYLGLKTKMWLVEKLNQQKSAALAKNLLQKHGGAILTTSMMANLTRFWVAYVAGVDSYSFTKFFKFSLVASLGWSSIMAMVGYFAGFERENIEKLAGSIGVAAWILLIAAIFVLLKSLRHEYQHFKKDIPQTGHDHS